MNTFQLRIWFFSFELLESDLMHVWKANLKVISTYSQEANVDFSASGNVASSGFSQWTSLKMMLKHFLFFRIQQGLGM